MEKIPFNISASAQAQTALISITGTIGWDTDCEIFRKQIRGLSQQGITGAHLYLNGPGGSCFDAEEIVNIIQSVFKGKITGEGGALVASAYTRIAAICSTFEQPENGMFMIHPPAGGKSGKASEIESYLKLLKDIEAQYFNTYKNKAVNPDLLAQKWQSGDWWMTAAEAKENGFITAVKKKINIDESTSALITACGCPPSLLPTINNHKNKKDMDLKAMAITLGLSADASEADVQAAINKARNAQNDLEALKMSNATKEREARDAEIKSILDKAETDKRITADTRSKWDKILRADFESGKDAIEALEAVVKPTVKHPETNTSGKVTIQGKTFEEMQEDDPDALGDLMKTDIEAYNALYENYLKRNNLKITHN